MTAQPALSTPQILPPLNPMTLHGSWAKTRPPHPLQKWRLKRTIAYVDAHLGAPIHLCDLAAAAGLTRMHFAAQFRAATGLRPHHYVLRRRVVRACELMRCSDLPLVQIALAVGFQTQAHFTTVFRRFIGETPHRWRRRYALPGPTVVHVREVATPQRIEDGENPPLALLDTVEGASRSCQAWTARR